MHVGEQVTVNPNVYCGLCDYCLAGSLILCHGIKGLGSNFPGVLRGVRRRFPSAWSSRPKGLPLDTAVFTEPAACAMHGLETLRVRPGSSALVFGAGPTGLLLAQLIKSRRRRFGHRRRARRGSSSTGRAASGSTTRSRSRGTDPAGNQQRHGRVRRARLRHRRRGDRCDQHRRHLRGLTRNGGTVLVYGVTRSDETRLVPPVRRVPPRDLHQGIVRGDHVVRAGDRSAATVEPNRRNHHPPVRPGRLRRGAGGPAVRQKRHTRS